MLKRITMLLFLLIAISVSAHGTVIHVQTQSVPNWQDRRTSATNPPHLRGFASASFFTSDGKFISAGQMNNANSAFINITCSQSGTTVTIPAFDIDSTTDASSLSRTSTYSFFWFSASGALLSPSPYLQNLSVLPSYATTVSCSPTPTCAFWNDLVIASTPTPSLPPDVFVTQTQMSAAIAAAVSMSAGIHDPGSNGILSRTAMNTVQPRSIAVGANMSISNADGSAGNPTISLSFTPYTDPMSTIGDIVIRNGSNLSARLPIGTASQVLTVTGGVPAWATPSSGFADPLTTQGDIIFRNASATTRLPRGAANTVLQSNGTTVVYAAVPDAALSANVPLLNANNVFTGINSLLAVPAADPAQGSTTTALMLRGADSTSASPVNTNNPSTYLQTIRTGGTNAVARFGFLWNYQVLGASAADNYVNYTLGRITPSMAGAPSGEYFHELNRNYLILSPTNISGQNIHGYGVTSVAERTVTGVRGIALYGELRNSTASDAAESTSSIDTMYTTTTSQGGTSHVSGLSFAEGPSNATSAYWGTYYAANSVTQRIFDLTDATHTLQGTWTATNGSATVTGSGGHAAVEAKQGAYLKANGTYARVAAGATANSIPLTANFSGSTGGSLTITQSVQAMWLRENQPISSLNHAGTYRNEILRYDETDHIRLDADGVGTIHGGYVSFGINAVGAPSDTLTSGYRLVTYEGGGGANYGYGIESGYQWYMGNGHRFYASTSASPVLALSVESDRTVRFYENPSNGSNYIGFKSPASLAGNTSYIWSPDGTAGYVLKTDGAGNLSWTPNLSGGAPTTSQYFLLTADFSLPNARTFTGTANQIILTDGGAGSTLSVSISPTLAVATSVTAPTMIGGSAVGSTLTIAGTSNGFPANANVFINPTYGAGTGTVVIGGTTTVSGGPRLDIQNTNVAGLRIVNTNASASAGGAGIQAGQTTLPTAADQRLSFYTFGATTGPTADLANGAVISGFSGEAWADATTPHGAYIKFETTTIGATSRAERWRVDDSGNWISVGKTFANLGTPANGSMVWCGDCKNVATDSATAGSVAANGGTGTFVFRVNGAWRIFY